MKLVTDAWSILDYQGKNSIDNAVVPNLLEDLGQIVSGLEDVADKNLRSYIENFHPDVHAHVLVNHF